VTISKKARPFGWFAPSGGFAVFRVRCKEIHYLSDGAFEDDWLSISMVITEVPHPMNLCAVTRSGSQAVML